MKLKNNITTLTYDYYGIIYYKMIYCIKFIYLYINQLSSSWSWDRLAFHLRFTSSSLSFVVTGGRERRRGLVSEVFSGVAMGVAGTPCFILFILSRAYEVWV